MDFIYDSRVLAWVIFALWYYIFIYLLPDIKTLKLKINKMENKIEELKLSNK
ncbi:MAG: hypothetical protein ACD_71C00209G0004 [uncultured bacterium (gcode 4)]|uniref:Uncharacterized protein n=1 Tax=uncultured bacterium (gcode 4) TaxID=1234023 RepID=K1Z3X3_9BACT|nr:MAG: hypothetical protein ACD_71C00209G0004 [uncultured bacterium (gcode 4)]